MPVLERDDGEIYYQVIGQGPPLVLVSGLGGVHEYWSNLIPEFTKSYTVILQDHMGTGRSHSRRLKHTVEALASDIDALATHLGHDRYSLIGHSTGAAVGQILAQNRFSRIQKMVLYAGWAGPDIYFAQCFKVRNALLKEVGVAAYNDATPLFLYPPRWISEHPAELATMIKNMNAHSPAQDVIANRIEMIVAFDRRSRMKEIKAPTLVICAEDDKLTPMHLSEELQNGIEGARLARLHWGAHACSQIAPTDFMEPVLAFLSER
jgi:aminoacrylate hydrolase